MREISKDLVYPELSYKILGVAFTVSNELGHGHLEKIYQRAFAKELQLKNIRYQEQVLFPVTYKEEVIGRNYVDFLIEDSVIVELKRHDIFSKKNIEQVVNYLKVSNLKLAILIHFSKEGVKHKRILNIN